MNNDNGNLTWIYRFELPQQCCNRCDVGTHRYVIGAFKEYPPNLKKVLICIGLNPNDGIPDKLEDTVQAINDFAFGNEIKFAFDDEERKKLPSWPLDGWIMLNLSPIRCGNSDSLSSMIDKDKIYEIAHKINIQIIKLILEMYPDAVRLAAWGTGITKRSFTKRSYLKETFDEFIEEEKRKKREWYCCYLPSDRDKELDKKQKELEKIEADLTQKNRDKALEKKQKELKNIEAGLTQEGHPHHPSINWGDKLEEAVINKLDISSYNPN